MAKKKNSIVRFDLGGFNISLSEESLSIITKAHTWQQEFYSGTFEYGMIASLLTEKNGEYIDTAQELITSIYACSVMMCHSSDFYGKAYGLIEDFMDSITEKNIPDEDDKKILDEEMALSRDG
jgi:hypothetical protein